MPSSRMTILLCLGVILCVSAVSVTAEVETHEEAMQQYEVEYQAFREAAKGEHSVELVAPAIWRNLEFPKAVMDEEGKPRPVCMTDRLWQAAAPFYKKIGVMLENGCKGESICDQPEVRDAYLPTADGHKTTVDVAFHVICESETKCPSGMNLQRVIDQMQTLNDDFHTANVFFSLDESRVFFHVNPTYSTIAAYGLLPTWLNQIRALKKQYAYEPASYLNIFVTGQKQGLLGTLLGIGTFPWDPEALTEYGGLWVNAEFCGGNQRTLSHEAGHNVGLWHSFHGVEEVGKCGSPCYEEPHPLGDQNANYVGDFCADTPAQPTNYQCAIPSGTACNGVEWSAYDHSGLLYNLMSYHADDCLESFTLSQAARAGCYLCNAIPSLTSAEDCNK